MNCKLHNALGENTQYVTMLPRKKAYQFLLDLKGKFKCKCSDQRCYSVTQGDLMLCLDWSKIVEDDLN